ncbi:probable 2-oxoglutarate-dependent dioxygenase AOP1 [Salvia splendens]|uniref:probable 2-oxoglutarate-dependent dioxygenase AOP1 n=1 Tax=Salvia splendens TaxID=180675 RepID=UPI001C26B687|nr:probable 2-oxoglutarate-dependent dioxygenase AOP1 [Salvia splendens]
MRRYSLVDAAKFFDLSVDSIKVSVEHLQCAASMNRNPAGVDEPWANRPILIEEDRIKAESERAKAPVDLTTLQLHNLMYEKNHYVKAIKACKDFKTNRRGDGIRQLFDLPLAIKLLNNSHKPLHGYIGQNNFSPHMESMGIDGALSSHVVDTFANLMWPDQGNPTFSKDIQLYCEKLSELDKIVRRMVVESLGLEKYIDEHLNSTNYLCRFQKYEAPRTPHSTLGFFPHADKNIISILHQLNHVNGLQILTKDGKTWIPADPTSLDSIVVMVATSFHAWTNGRLHAPIHRVVVSGDEARYTIGLFSVPKEGCVIKTPEELVNKDHPLLYKPFDYYKFIDFIYTDAGRFSPDPLKEYCGA